MFILEPYTILYRTILRILQCCWILPSFAVIVLPLLPVNRGQNPGKSRPGAFSMPKHAQKRRRRTSISSFHFKPFFFLATLFSIIVPFKACLKILRTEIIITVYKYTIGAADRAVGLLFPIEFS